jgi:hypothetical protein
MHCQTLLPGKSGIVIKEDPESQYHLLQGSSGLFSVPTADSRPVRHYLRMCCVGKELPGSPAGASPTVILLHRKTKIGSAETENIHLNALWGYGIRPPRRSGIPS